MDLVILIGLQGSGKTTFYRTHFAATHEQVSKDRFRHNKKPSSGRPN
jgi:predicted kinase